MHRHRLRSWRSAAGAAASVREGQLAGTTVGLTAFLANPEAFINGAKDLAQVVGANVVRPILQVPAAAVEGVARGTNWTVIFLAAGAVGLLWWLAKHGYLQGEPTMKPPDGIHLDLMK